MDKKIKNINIEFNNLTYSVTDQHKNGRKKILKEISGEFKSGEITAIMGPSGAGKTTLLNILTGFTGNGVKGYINLFDKSFGNKKYYKLCSYILQEDNLYPNFNVQETMMFAASLKIAGISKEEKELLIDNILNTLNLSCTKTINCDNLSGGQKKRLSIALELLDNPPILFLDEPTTGLDSVASADCIALLQNLAREGRTIVCTIHQPDATTYTMFDHIYVLADGYCVYQGSADNTISYLQSNGLQCPQYHNPADFLIIKSKKVKNKDSMENINSNENDSKSVKKKSSENLKSQTNASETFPTDTTTLVPQEQRQQQQQQQQQQNHIINLENLLNATTLNKEQLSKEIACLKCCIDTEKNYLDNNFKLNSSPSQPIDKPQIVNGRQTSTDDKLKNNQNRISKELLHSYNMQEKLVADNVDLENDRYKLQEILLSRDRIIENLQDKLEKLQTELIQICNENQENNRSADGQKKGSTELNETHSSSTSVTNALEKRLSENKSFGEYLEKQLHQIALNLKKIKIELLSLQKDREKLSEYKVQSNSNNSKSTTSDAVARCCTYCGVNENDCCASSSSSDSDSNINKHDNIKCNYTILLCDLAKKDNKIQELNKKLDFYLCDYTIDGGRQTNNRETHEQIELIMCKKRLQELTEAEDNYKYLLKEQSDQLDDYRKKYLLAEQHYQEQLIQMEKLTQTNEQIEKQIKTEIERIKKKFQDKLGELTPLPKLLKTEQLKCAEYLKEIQYLNTELTHTVNELVTTKELLKNCLNEKNALAEKYDKNLLNLKKIEKLNEKLQSDTSSLELRCTKLQDELTKFQTESAKIINRTRERSASNQENFQHHVNHLEIELAQCRANATLVIAERDNMIKQMREQLNTLSHNFDESQMQITNLKNHITLINNQNNKINRIDL